MLFHTTSLLAQLDGEQRRQDIHLYTRLPKQNVVTEMRGLSIKESDYDSLTFFRSGLAVTHHRTGSGEERTGVTKMLLNVYWARPALHRETRRSTSMSGVGIHLWGLV